MTAADVNVTELVARALWAAWCTGDPFAAIEGPSTERECEHLDNLTGAALAALRSPEVVAGIAGVLAAHGSGYWTDPRGWEWAACSGCEWNRDLGADGLLSRSEGAGPHAEHQARAVVDWLAGGGA